MQMRGLFGIFGEVTNSRLPDYSQPLERHWRSNRSKKMPSLQRLCILVMLVGMLAIPTHAGVITTMAASPPPATAQGDIHCGASGQIETGATLNSQPTNDDHPTDLTTAQLALSLLQGMLSLYL